MIAKKIYNNNVVLVTENDSGKELVVTGCGIGFQKKVGSEIDQTKIEKKFLIQDDSFENKVHKLSKEIPEEVFNISSAIIEQAEKVLETSLDEYIYISLTDHIAFALKRHEENLDLKNELMTEIRRIHKKEYELGKWSIEKINNEFGVNLPIDEAGFIAIHIINANYRESTTKSYLMIEIIHEVLAIIKKYFDIEFIEEDINYDRLLTHLKFFAKRLIEQKQNDDESENTLINVIKLQYPDSYECTNKVREFIQNKYDYEVKEDEVLYLTLHINRVITVINFKK